MQTYTAHTYKNEEDKYAVVTTLTKFDFPDHMHHFRGSWIEARDFDCKLLLLVRAMNINI